MGVGASRATLPHYGALAELLGVELPDAVAQGGGEGYPGEVGEEEDSSQSVASPVHEYVEDDEGQQQQNVYEGSRAELPFEKEPGPEAVEDELQAEDGEFLGDVGGFRVAPDEPGCDAHERVESGPYRTEEPARRGPCGLLQGRVVRFSRYRCNPAYGRHRVGNSQRGNELERLAGFVCFHWANFAASLPNCESARGWALAGECWFRVFGRKISGLLPDVWNWQVGFGYLRQSGSA